jgi:general secretion pathway protein B
MAVQAVPAPMTPASTTARSVAAASFAATPSASDAGAVAQASTPAAKPRKAEANPPPEPRATADAKVDAKLYAAPSPKAAAKSSPPPVAVERVPLLAELPEDVQRQVPALKLGGLVYSSAPASRMVIVNGDVQREGSTVAPGLTLEHIKPKSAVFAIRGQRFEVPL